MMRKLAPEKRENFLNAALKLFVVNGVQKTTTAEIAKEAGTATGTLFLYFPTKQDLIHELVLQVARDQSEHMNTLLEPALSARDMFFTIWDGSIRWFLANMDAYRFIQQVRDTRLVAESVVQESNKFFDYYYEVIQKGLKENSIKRYPAEVIGNILYHDLVAITDIVRTQSNPGKQADIIQMGFDIFWNGIKAGGEGRSTSKG